MTDDWVTVEEISKRSGKSLTTVRRLVRQAKLEHREIGPHRKRHYPYDQFVKLLNASNKVPLRKKIFTALDRKAKKINRNHWFIIVVGLSSILGLIITLIAIMYKGESEKQPNPLRALTIESIAILSLTSPDVDRRTKNISDGIAQSLSDSLSQLPKLKVISRGSSSRYKDQDIDLQAVGRDLKVDAALTVRVGLVNDNILVNVELIDVNDGHQIWVKQYDRKLADLPSMLVMLAKEISERLRLKLTGEEQNLLLKRYTDNPEAFILYSQGRHQWNKRTEEGFNKAIKYFQDATRIDPKYALAYDGLADTYNLLARYGFVQPDEAFPKAKEAATKALTIDSKLAEAHASLAYTSFSYDWDWAGAESGFKRAIELSPSCANAHHWYGLYLAAMGRLDEATVEIKLAKEYDPNSFIINSNLGRLLYYQRQFDDSIKQYQNTIDLQPDFAEAHLRLGQAYQEKGMYDKAVRELQKANNLSKDSTSKGVLGYVYARAAKKSEAEKIIEELKELSKQRYVSSYHVALVYIGLEDKDQALEWLEKAYKERYTLLVYIKVDPEIDNLRSDARFQDLLRRIGLPK